jgi:predicted O-linked N-acetylglucosamine transferase (SPINDLY family)
VPREDDLTARIKPRFAQWRRIDGLDDEAAARLIFADSPDVLLDLSGHTAHNRLGVFAWRPAPVQAGWLGYFATTGLAAMDWVIADRASVQEAQHAHFTERIWYLPQTRLCFTPPDQAPVAGPLPAQANGFVTFGSFQNLGKVNEQVLALWSRVLEAVPGSRLRWQNALLADEATRDLVRRRMAARGIEPSRLRFQGKVSRRAYLAAYNEIDIVLDSFPYPGGTTTCEALWMGVPTVTLQGDRMLSRQGAALLAAAGVPQWIAGDQEEYVANAAALAGDLPALAELRRTLRERVATSALFDARRFAREFAQALHSMASATPAP